MSAQAANWSEQSSKLIHWVTDIIQLSFFTGYQGLKIKLNRINKSKLRGAKIAQANFALRVCFPGTGDLPNLCKISGN